MVVKTIKNIDNETWIRFRNLSVKNRVTMARLLRDMIENYEHRSTKFWNKILNAEKIISDKEADEIEKITKRIRKEYGFRV
ncbi:hypothetical protein HZA96_07010 [Candidatus Woesearchaeota archaeon]|nr:hypothetical protein [Candidatus Woesearchaeota archaeon]